MSDAIVATIIEDWRFIETPYNRRQWRNPAHSELAAWGAEVGLFHYVLRRTAMRYFGKSESVGYLSKGALTFGSMDNAGRDRHA